MAKKKIEIMMTDDQVESLRRRMIDEMTALSSKIPALQKDVENAQATLATATAALSTGQAKSQEAREAYESAFPQVPPPRP